MPSSVACALALAIALVAGACGNREAEQPEPLVAPVEGDVTVEGLSAPVRVVRDEWGVAHIAATTQADLFFAQGFVQAQDRLFQMDLWRRAAQGRLAEVLGANFILRDVMTRRMQYRGDLEEEWTSYGEDVRDIATAFVDGVNAWVRRAQDQLPEEFIMAGWSPELWRPEDLLNRTDAFVESGNAMDEVFRARLAAAVGVSEADRLLPPRAGRPTTVPRDFDLALVSPVVADAVRRVGTDPFFLGLAAIPNVLAGSSGTASGSNAWAIAPARASTGAALLAVDPHRRLAHPSLRYLVHLEAPGWHVAGATAPWRPGVSIGHNERIAWGMTTAHLDTQDIYVERLHPEDPRRISSEGSWIASHIERDTIAVLGRSEPFEYETQVTPHGVVIAVDPDQHLAYALRWSGAEPGAAPELAALAIDRAQSWVEFADALTRWKMPAAEFVYADVDGHIASQTAGLLPVRSGWNGALPVPGWSGAYEWQGWTPLDRLPRSIEPRSAVVVSANESRARRSRIQDVLSRAEPADTALSASLQHDVLSWNAQQLVPLLRDLVASSTEAEDARVRLLRWDGRVIAGDRPAALYVAWERALLDRLVRLRVPASLADQAADRARSVLVPSLVDPSSVWFDGVPDTARDELLMAALATAVASPADPVQATFAHPLAITDALRARFNVGPIQLPGAVETVFSTAVAGDYVIGPSFRMIADVSDWDHVLVTNVPGQSGTPSSPHFRDLVPGWASGEYFPLVFSPAGVAQHAAATLMLVPGEL